MIFRENPKNGEKLSQLAFGLMRLPRDDQAVRALIARAVEAGINYFDTAYIYPGNESAFGRALSALGMRDRINIATKLPPFLVRKYEDLDKILNTELDRLETDHIDYYLVHMLSDETALKRLNDLGFDAWAAQKQASGVIRNLGFSFHGSTQNFIEIVDARAWDFTMIQYNYLDEHQQAGRRGLEYAAHRGLPIMIMEPLRGGSLVNGLPRDAKDAFRAVNPDRSFADWGLRWVLNHPEVTTVLSGMSTLDMLEENIKLACECTPSSLSADEMRAYEDAKRAFFKCGGIPCTGCAYCMPCPAGVDIPLCFATYNDRALDGQFTAFYRYAFRTKGHDASMCVGCGKCEAHCPQQIPIRSALAKVNRAMAGGLKRLPHIALKKFYR